MVSLIYQYQKRSNDFNFIIKHDIAYTEDKVVVYNLFLYKLPIATKERDLKSYFSRFGKITYVRIPKQVTPIRRNTKRIGFVNFEDAKSACRALAEGPHTMFGIRIGVKACDSWHQPTEAINQAADASGVSSLASGILNLNEYCLLEVCSYLSLTEQLKFARSCKRVRDVFVAYGKTKYKTVETQDLRSLTLWDLRMFFEMVGPSLEKVSGDFDEVMNGDRMFEFLVNNACNLKHLIYEGAELRFTYIRKLAQKCPLLESLEIRQSNILDNNLVPLQTLANLRSLTLIECYSLSGSTLRRLTQLTDLKLFTCPLVVSEFVAAAFRSLNGLKSFSMQRCERADPTCFMKMPIHCPQMERLEISWTPVGNYKWLSEMTNLRHLELLTPITNGAASVKMSETLASLKFSQLEYFKLLGRNMVYNISVYHISAMSNLKYLAFCNNDFLEPNHMLVLAELHQLEELVMMNTNNLNASVLLEIVRKCPKLHTLHIQRCLGVNNTFATGCETILEKRRDKQGTSKPMLMVYANNSGIIKEQVRESPSITWDFTTPVVKTCTENFRNLDVVMDIYDQNFYEGLYDDDQPYLYDSDSEFDIDEVAYVFRN